MGKSIKKIFFPKTRFSELAARSGGITRGAAIEGAMQNLESMREESNGIIEESVRAIEAVAYAPHTKGKFNENEMRTLLRYADQVVTLAGTFGYVSLDTATKSLCDVIDGMLSIKNHEAAPILVHVQAIRLVAPGGVVPTEDKTQKILSELAKILLHFNFTSLGAAADSDDPGLPNVA